MSNKGVKTCPLCTEEMDMTDQQLKPCQCGYEICVWCWNHIMEMAEKDKIEGRCPACRTPYDEKRIVQAAANCERLMAELNLGKKSKPQKVKPKTSEGRIHLTNVRVIQRNLVYVIGLPLDLADEALLQQKEYFGQYGKVMKVSISRTSTGAIQNSSNNSCCVYITYSKEEEAVRCIQSVHSFVLEGKSLRACFGTTKYCHAWLKNMPCNIPDCLYLHDFGSEEDSFTKDDLVSAFTRSKIQQITGEANNFHRPPGNVLPPPANELTNRNMSSPIKLDSKILSNRTDRNPDSRSCMDNGTERSNEPPGTASWVMRASARLPPVTSLSAGGSSDHVSKTPNSAQGLRPKVKNFERFSDAKPTVITNESCGSGDDFLTPNNLIPCLPTSQDVAGDSLADNIPSNLTNPSGSLSPLKDERFGTCEVFQGLAPRLSSISVGGVTENECLSSVIVEYSSNHGSKESIQDIFSEPSTSTSPRGLTMVEDLLGFDDEKLKGFEGTGHPPCVSSSSSSNQNLKFSSHHPWQQGNDVGSSIVSACASAISVKDGAISCTVGNPILSNRFYDSQSHFLANCLPNNSSILSELDQEKYLGMGDNPVAFNDQKVASDNGEASIISSVLAMDGNAWEDLLTLPENLMKFLTKTHKQHESLNIPSLRKVQDCSQSRFSFAREDDFVNQVPGWKQFPENTITETRDKKDHFTSSNRNTIESTDFLGSHLHTSSFPVFQAPTSPPAGFVVPNTAISSGFPIHERLHCASLQSVNHGLQNSVPLMSNVDNFNYPQFTDPTIEGIGQRLHASRVNKMGFDMAPALSPSQHLQGHNVEFQVQMQQSVSAHQNPSFPDYFRSKISSPDDAYSITSPSFLGWSASDNPSLLAQLKAQQLRTLHASNGHWSDWNEVTSASDLGLSQQLAFAQGFDKSISVRDNLKYQMSSSSNLYHKGFAM
ncbi:hypothetical protein K2173_002127 [Erythroxylum novogranatense]|uniref:CCR4-NOT transcription complex subunit 4 n=1 Tax=Erythroxylum novogranatense TaxID=1862640 RepID=A0AAV8SPM0_9ROSI|nr:hypothetical protein K2173_002127 [Erythroxylum novogranatense]